MNSAINTRISQCELVGMKQGIVLRSTVKTVVFEVFVNGISSTGIELEGGRHTIFSSVSVSNVSADGIKVRTSNRTAIRSSVINGVTGNGIEFRNTLRGLVSQVYIMGIGRGGITVRDAVQTLVSNTTINSTMGSGMEFVNVETIIILYNTVADSGAVGVSIDNARGTTANFNNVIDSVTGIKICNAVITRLGETTVLCARALCFDQCGETDTSLQVLCL